MAAPMITLRLGRKTPAAATGSACDEECECLQAVFAFEDDFCGPAPLVGTLNDHWFNLSVASGSVTLIGRTAGWWRFETSSTPIPGSAIASVRTLGDCFGVLAGAKQAMFGKAHIVMAEPLGQDGEFLFEFNGVAPPAVGVLLTFRGFQGTWHVRFTQGAPPVDIDTNIPISTDCTKPDRLEIIATGSVVRWLINGAQVHSIVPNANLLAAVFSVIFRLNSDTVNPVQFDVDLFCGRNARFCRNTPSPC